MIYLFIVAAAGAVIALVMCWLSSRALRRLRIRLETYDLNSELRREHLYAQVSELAGIVYRHDETVSDCANNEIEICRMIKDQNKRLEALAMRLDRFCRSAEKDGGIIT